MEELLEKVAFSKEFFVRRNALFGHWEVFFFDTHMAA
jgi:hypothetical protein